MLKVDADAIAELLGKVAAGEIDAETWHNGFDTWTIRTSGYVIEIFDDANEADYVSFVTDPEGKTARFMQFMNARGRDPIAQLTEEQRTKLSSRLFGDSRRAQIKALEDKKKKGGKSRTTKRN